MADTPSRGAVEEMISFYSRFDPATYLSDLETACRRQDGRSNKQLRPLKLLQGVLQKSTAGSSLAKIGDTKVLAGVSLQVGQPGEDSPEKGEIGVEVNLLPLCHPKFSSIQAQQEESKALENFVQSVLLRCNVVRREDLCIVEGRHVWKLNVDLQCLSHDGSLADACVLSALLALADVTLPVTIVDTDEKVVVLHDRPPRRLEMARFPIPLTIGFHADMLLGDLSLAEEERIPTRLRIAVDCETGQLCTLQKLGGVSMASEHLDSAVALCGARQKQFLLERDLRQDKS